MIADRVRDLPHRKTQAEIAPEAGFANANMMTFLKVGRNKVPLDRVPSLAKAPEVDPALLMRLALDRAVGATAAKAIVEIFGTPVTQNERGGLAEIRHASGNCDPRLTGCSHTALKGDLWEMSCDMISREGGPAGPGDRLGSGSINWLEAAGPA
nr:XRE family transcriptional regulator [Paracoccus bogoriensis]